MSLPGTGMTPGLRPGMKHWHLMKRRWKKQRKKRKQRKKEFCERAVIRKVSACGEIAEKQERTQQSVAFSPVFDLKKRRKSVYKMVPAIYKIK